MISLSSTSSASTKNWYQPAPLVTWQWQLKGTVNTKYAAEIYDIDLFDSSTDLIKQLRLSGKKVICYFSAGTSETWRSDNAQFTSSDKGQALPDWPGEHWLDIRSENVLRIMKLRLDLAKSKGCDGVEPDNVDGYTNSPGFPLAANDQLVYNRALAKEAHARNLTIGLKNDLDQIVDLVDDFDFAVNEQCSEFSECDLLTPFIKKGKAVLIAEYKNTYITNSNARATLCSTATSSQFSTLVLALDLDDSLRFSCL